MTETTAVIAQTAVASFLVLVGILLNQWQNVRLDGRIDCLKNSMRSEIAATRSELTGFRSQMHSDIIELVKVSVTRKIV